MKVRDIVKTLEDGTVVPGEGQGRPLAVQTPQQVRAGDDFGKSSDDLAPGT